MRYACADCVLGPLHVCPAEAVQRAGQSVTWVCDPMHGNTETVAGFKTRRYDNIRCEIEAFFDVHDQMGTVPGAPAVHNVPQEGQISHVRHVWNVASLHAAEGVQLHTNCSRTSVTYAGLHGHFLSQGEQMYC